MDWQAEADVLVVGGGGGGLVAAISAADEGASVVLIEKSPQLGGNSALSSGSVPGAGTRFQREAGIDDSPQVFVEDVLRRTDNTAPRHLVELLARESAPLVEWLVDRVGAPLKLVPDLKKVGHSVPRTHAPPGREGSVLVQALERAALAKDVVLAPGHPVERLILDDNGTIIGAAVEGNGRGVTDNVRASKVILAANGFGGNRDMLRKYCAEIAEAPYFGHQGNTGDAIRWGMELGADLANMAAYQGHASVAYPHGHLLSWTVMERGGFLVNKEGRRFVDETLGYSGCASKVRAQPDAVAFAVFDTRTHEYLLGTMPEYADLAQSGGVKIGDDVGEMARAFELPEEAVRATLAEYHAGIANGNDRFDRAAFGVSPLRAPYAMVRVTAGLFHTQGGLAVDSNAQPTRNGVAIPNLYAVGGTAVGIAGADGGRGYVSASGLLAALGLGRVAGRHAARSL
jgi:fumarate reductase flavoprotein subunit